MTRAERRSLVPQFEERTNYGRKDTDPYSKLFEERIVFLGAPVDDISANDVTAQMLALEGMDPDRPISLYINSPGGSLTSMLAICDTMRYVRPEVETTCVGRAGSAAAVLLAAGSPGRRQALRGARILLHEPAIEVSRGYTTDLDIQAREVLRLRAQTEAILAEATGRTPETVRHDLDRERYFTAEEAKDYGLIDAVLTSRN
ncbi:ATP-dependent Clp protease proteolytic subunit [Actinomadura madurae]|uniref:ATP-dependent Clp protease proteolytic subunit n=1 Tax=Actinomadura madurae TaxID=1993 RepID=UPI00399B093D